LAVVLLSVCLLVAPNMSPTSISQQRQQQAALQQAIHRLQQQQNFNAGMAEGQRSIEQGEPFHVHSRTLMDYVGPENADSAFCAESNEFEERQQHLGFTPADSQQSHTAASFFAANQAKGNAQPGQHANDELEYLYSLSDEIQEIQPMDTHELLQGFGEDGSKLEEAFAGIDGGALMEDFDGKMVELNTIGKKKIIVDATNVNWTSGREESDDGDSLSQSVRY